MIKTILHQIWNERRQNGWLFLELVAVSVFLWLAIDPLFILESRRRIPAGYNPENVYIVDLKEYNKTNVKWRKEAANDSVSAAVYSNAFDIIRKIPEVQYVGTCYYSQYPTSGSHSSTIYRIDSLQTVDGKEKKISAVLYYTSAVEGDDWPAVLGLTDALTGEPLHIVRNENVRNVFVSSNFAIEAYGTVDVVGREIDNFNNEPFVICGVYDNIQFMKYANPGASVINVSQSFLDNFSIMIRIKEGVDGKEFMRRFNKEYAPQLAGGNVYCMGLISYHKDIGELEEKMGYNNTYRMQTALTLFALLCAFLGVVSTFWIRANVRRRDIGVMRSVGASPGRIVAQFVAEASLLVTVAFIVALPLLLHKVYAMGFASPIPEYLVRNEQQNDFIHDIAWMHFAAVSLITYIIILLVAVVGAAIPALRISKILPSDALREE